MKKYLADIKNDNDKRYWGTMIKLNQDNYAFREAF